MVGGKPFVVSTSYNGRGPVSYTARNKKRVNVFCNPRYRGLGPGADHEHGVSPKVDAFLWLNRPGLSRAPVRATAARCRWAAGGRRAR